MIFPPAPAPDLEADLGLSAYPVLYSQAPHCHTQRYTQATSEMAATAAAAGEVVAADTVPFSRMQKVHELFVSLLRSSHHVRARPGSILRRTFGPQRLGRFDPIRTMGSAPLPEHLKTCSRVLFGVAWYPGDIATIF